MKDNDFDFDEELFNIHRPQRLITDPVEKELMKKSDEAFKQCMEQPTLENKLAYDKIQEEMKEYRKHVIERLKQEVENERESK